MTVYFGLLLSLATTGDLTADQATQLNAPVIQQRTNEARIQPISLLALAKQDAKKKAESSPIAFKVTKQDSKTTKKAEPATNKKSSVKSAARTATKKDANGKPAPLKPLKRRVLVFKAEWCGACQQLSTAWPSLRKVRWRVGTKDTDHFQLIDVDQHRNIMNKYGVNSLPTVILVEGDKVLDRRGVLSSIDLAELYYGRLR
jgi:thiol-disulfide isomerase/thioredoxin